MTHVGQDLPVAKVGFPVLSLDLDYMSAPDSFNCNSRAFFEAPCKAQRIRRALGFFAAFVFAAASLAGLPARSESSVPSAQLAPPPPSSVATAPLKVARTNVMAESQRQLTESESKCPADVPQRPLVECMSGEIEAIDLRIEHALASSIATLPGAEVSDVERAQARTSLLAAQAAWKEYRERSCTAILLYLDNGDAGVLEYLDCKRRLAERKRAAIPS